MKPLVVILAILLALLAIGWLAADTSVSLAQSRAVIEAAQAAQESARAAQIASAGNVVMGSGLIITLSVLVISLVAAVTISVYFYLRSKGPRRQVVIRPRVRSIDDLEQLPASHKPEIEPGDPLEQLIKLQMLDMVSRMSERQAAQQQPRLPSETDRRW